MKSKLLLLFPIVLLLFAGCNNEEVQLGSLYGTVNEKVTGNAIANVSVELIKSDEKSGESITTDDDGSFEFRSIEEGVYNLLLQKPGYESVTKEGIVVKGGTTSKPVFVQMEKLPPSFRIIDDSGKDITEINFGYEPEDNMRTFTILNDGEDKFEWSIPAEGRAKWIKTISPSDGELRSGKSQPVLVVIDRDVLKEGNSEATIVVQTTNNVGKEIKVTALAYQAPVINLYEPTDVSYENVTLEAVVTNTGFPEYRLFGFFVSQDLQHNLKNADKNDKNISIPKKDADDMMTSKGKISQVVANLTPNATYYARAYAIRDIDTTYSFNVIKFVTKIPNLPKLTITKKSEEGLKASFYSEIIDNGGSIIEAKGVCWSTNQMPTVEDSKTVDGTGNVSFYSTISGLEPNKTYYVRAYAKNSDGFFGYSDKQEIIVTSEGAPTVVTYEPVNTTSESVDVRYEITDNAGSTITEHGVCYSTYQWPDTTSEKVQGSGTNPSYIAHISNLQDNTTYYARAYAKNSAGVVGYGGQQPFETKEGKAKVVTGECSATSSTTAVCKGTIETDNGRPITERGICWSKNANPTINGIHTSDGKTGTGAISCTITNLEPGTEYHACAYAINSAGTSYGDILSFITDCDKPKVTTQTPSNITSTSAKISGTIGSIGCSRITMTGFLYQKEGEQTVYQVQASLSGTTFAVQVENLIPNSTYYVQAVAQNDEKLIGEGTVVSFTTKGGQAQVSTGTYSNVGPTTATVTGKIINDNGFPVTECGICYSSTNRKPTLADNYVSKNNVRTGEYSCELTGLDPSTTYYARAYAINTSSSEPAYDDYNIKFKTTDGMPSVIISQQPTYNGNNATIYGKITSDGGVDIVYYGAVLSRTNTQPSIDDREVIINQEGNPSSNDITFTLNNIPSGTMLYYRFYVVNSLANVAYSPSSGYVVCY